MKTLMIFLDGVGIGTHNPERNPFCFSDCNLLNHFTDIKRDKEIPFQGRAKGVDATLDMEGLPQSGTGQTTIFTGINAAKELGYHLYGFPNKKLRQIILKHSLLKQLKEKGVNSRFVNVYRPIFFKLGDEIKKVKLSATTYANLAADLPFLKIEDILKENGIYQEFTNQALRDRGFDVPLVTPEKAGEILAHLTQKYDFTLYEYFQTDKAGHSQNMDWGKIEVNKLERFLMTLFKNLDLDKTVVFICSDHGNLEDLSTRSHTRNPSLFMAWGPKADVLVSSVYSLTDITPTVIHLFK